MEFENAFSRPGKVMDFRRNGRGHGKVMEFHFFGPKISCCLKTEKTLLVTEIKIWLQKAGFSAFHSRGKVRLVMKKSWKSHGILLPNFCMNPGYDICEYMIILASYLLQYL